MRLLAWLEQTGLSIWVRESVWGFPVTLIIHSLSLALLTGICIATSLRLFGLMPSVSPAVLHRNTFRPACFLLLVCLVSGLTLLAAYPAKALTNWVFWIKLLLIATGMFLLNRVKDVNSASGSEDENPVTSPGLAASLLIVWLGVIVGGRFLAYTYQVLMVSEY